MNTASENTSTNISNLMAKILSGDPAAMQDLAKQMAARQKQIAEIGVKHEGSQIILPAQPDPMPLLEAAAFLTEHARAADQIYEIYEAIDGYPFDAAAAFYRALQNRYGFVNSVTTQHTNWMGEKFDVPPDMRQIKTGPNPEDITQVPVGGFQLPGFENPIETGFRRDRKTEKVVFLVTGKLKAKDRDAIREILADTARELQQHSIYKGRAIILKTDEDGDVLENDEPEFMATDKIDPSRLVLPRNVEELLQDTLFTLIQKTERCRELRIPLKRTVALAGPYGTGKTLCAYVTAKHCVDSREWTYVMVDRAEGLAGALRFARRYQPCVVFAEDIDRVTATRDDEANDLLNEVDGILAKDSEIITILTTNHLDRIQKAMLRPGRTDAIIPINAPDAEAAQRLVRLFAGDLIGDQEPLESLGAQIKGYIPAVIREIVERSKLSMISRNDDKLSVHDLLAAAHSMKAHSDLISESVEGEEINVYEKAGRAISGLFENGPIARMNDKIGQIHNEIC
jgi:SpoVK/Ycf46/Vps4 family AAA+-type ATPase